MLDHPVTTQWNLIHRLGLHLVRHRWSNEAQASTEAMKRLGLLSIMGNRAGNYGDRWSVSMWLPLRVLGRHGFALGRSSGWRLYIIVWHAWQMFLHLLRGLRCRRVMNSLPHSTGIRGLTATSTVNCVRPYSGQGICASGANRS